jgi:hypothetical protein
LKFEQRNDRQRAEEAGEIRAAIERAGTPIGPYDVLIAAQARRRSALLVTANTGELARVPGLNAEDWATPDGAMPPPLQSLVRLCFIGTTRPRHSPFRASGGSPILS